MKLTYVLLLLVSINGQFLKQPHLRGLQIETKQDCEKQKEEMIIETNAKIEHLKETIKHHEKYKNTLESSLCMYRKVK